MLLSKGFWPPTRKESPLALVAMLGVLIWASGCPKAPEPGAKTQPAAAKSASQDSQDVVPREKSQAGTSGERPAEAKSSLPLLLDLGSVKCIPCKMMAPILEELKTEYAGSLEVRFIDVWQDRDAAARYGIEAIPTQVFYDAEGRERFRHVGFLGKEEILAKWRELGIELRKQSSERPPIAPQ